MVIRSRFLAFFQSLEGKSLRDNRIPVSVMPIVKMHLGDMLHTLVWHNARHALQAAEAGAV